MLHAGGGSDSPVGIGITPTLPSHAFVGRSPLLLPTVLLGLRYPDAFFAVSHLRNVFREFFSHALSLSIRTLQCSIVNFRKLFITCLEKD